MSRPHAPRRKNLAAGDPAWYKDAILYETHVRAFFDSNGDGIGDFPGLTSKLDYLQDLGITAVWLLPFYPSPLKDDGYDIADPMDVHPSYGTLADFKTFLREAHRRGLRVITELVLNHTSDQHPWFQRARRARPGSAVRNFYVWSDTPDRYKETRVIFQDFEASNWTWDPVAKAYFWHRFYSHQPDLNFDSPDVRRHVFRILDFWLRMGVDGLRLDAIPYLYERDGTNCENLPETHAFLKTLRRHVDETFRDRMLLAEANQWPEDAAAYFGNGDECHMAFHFPLMPRMFMALRMEDRFPIVDILEQTPAIPEGAQWALFLRNHDELTLEMVTDEERDYMYRVYAADRQMRINVGIRRRLAPLLGNDRRRIELLHGLLLSLPGTPVLYYGDEIGMGDNIYLGDRNGVRTPMQWSNDRNAGFSRAAAQRLFLPVVTDPEYHFEAVNVEVQQNNPSSPLWWTKRLIALRKRFQAFSRGSFELVLPDNRKVLAYVRRLGDETILVVANLSRFVQPCALDLSAFAGLSPVEMFGRNAFPAIGAEPYPLTLGPHNFYWFTLEPHAVDEAGHAGAPPAEVPVLTAPGGWEGLWQGGPLQDLEEVLSHRLAARHASIAEAIPIGGEDRVRFVLVRIESSDAEPATCLLPLGFAAAPRSALVWREHPQTVVAEIQETGGRLEGVAFDASQDETLAADLLAAIARNRRWKGPWGELVAKPEPAFRDLKSGGHRFLLKLVSRPEPGVNPDLEVGRFLAEQTGFRHTPALAGCLELRPAQGEPMTLGLLQELVPNHGDGWSYTLDALGRFLERMLGKLSEMPQPPEPDGSLLALAAGPPPPRVAELLGSYLQWTQLLGMRTAELHLALASRADAPDFAPEPFGTLYQRSLYQSIRSVAVQSLQLLRKRLRDLPPDESALAHAVLDREGDLTRRLRDLLGEKLSGLRLRIHGDYQLGEILFTGKDFVIPGFKGDSSWPLSARRLKRSALVDVAGMLRSFQQVAGDVLLGRVHSLLRPVDARALQPWLRFWTRWVSAAFLGAYLDKAREGSFLPSAPGELAVLLDVLLLEKAVDQLGDELKSRLEGVSVPLAGILEVLGHAA